MFEGTYTGRWCATPHLKLSRQPQALAAEWLETMADYAYQDLMVQVIVAMAEEVADPADAGPVHLTGIRGEKIGRVPMDAYCRFADDQELALDRISSLGVV